MNINAFPNNIPINPEDFRELAFVTDFYNRRSGISINVDSISLKREEYARAMRWLYQEQGRFEGAPAILSTQSGLQLKYYLDFSESVIGYDRIDDVALKARKSHGQFFEDADNLTWAVVKDRGFLPDSLAIQVPYLIVPDNLQEQQAFAVGQVFLLAYQGYVVIFEIAKSVAAFLDVLGTGLLTAAFQLAALIAFFVLLIAQIIQTVAKLIELFFPKLRYFKAFRDFDLINEAVKSLGYTLSSNLLSTELYPLCTMGKPEAQTNFSVMNFLQNELTQFFNKGYPTAQDTTPTLGELINFIETTYNARTLVYDGVVKIEKRSTYIDTASTILVPTLTDQDTSDDNYRFHSQDDWGRAYDHWQIDFNDIHSPDQADKIQSEFITTQINTINPDLVRLTGLRENSAPFALAGRKNGFTKVELIVKKLFGDFMGVIINAQGQPQVNNVSDRVGVMMVEKQFFSVTKKLWLDVDANRVGKQPVTYKDKLSMRSIHYLYKQDLNVRTNNRIVKESKVPFTDQMYIDAQLNNFMVYQSPNSSEPASKVELIKIEYFDTQNCAKISILLPDNSAFNTQTIDLLA